MDEILWNLLQSKNVEKQVYNKKHIIDIYYSYSIGCKVKFKN